MLPSVSGKLKNRASCVCLDAAESRLPPPCGLGGSKSTPRHFLLSCRQRRIRIPAAAGMRCRLNICRLGELQPAHISSLAPGRRRSDSRNSWSTLSLGRFQHADAVLFLRRPVWPCAFSLRCLNVTNSPLHPYGVEVWLQFTQMVLREWEQLFLHGPESKSEPI